MMPTQRPGKSKQDYGTPPEVLDAIKSELGIEDFLLDVAASDGNNVCQTYYTDEMDGLSNPWTVLGWAWCNPPYGDIAPWVRKAAYEASRGANIAMLVPASPGSNWWRDYVDGVAYVLWMNGRVKFVGATGLYPKDTAILVYTPWLRGGNRVWNWRKR